VPVAHNELEVYSARLAPGEAAGSRRPGARGSLVALRRRVIAKLRGEQDVTSLLRHGLVVGKEVFIARGCYIDPGYAWLVSIGDQATIGPNVTILAHDASPKLRTGVSLLGAVRIGARVFIGANSTILPGVAIGDDAIVGAGTVVREDVEQETIVIGNPAVVVGTTEAHTRHHGSQSRTRPRYQSTVAEDAATIRTRLVDQLADGPGYVD
jgi:maltose O-acetyltransferase